MRKAASSPAAPDPILQAADRMAPRLRQAFLDAVAAARVRVSLAEIERALTAGDVNRVVALLDGSFTRALEGVGLAAGMASLRDVLQATFGAGAQSAAAVLPARAAIELSFNLLNPEAVAFLNRYTFDLIQQVSAETRGLVQQTVLRGFQQGLAPRVQARDLKQVIGLTARQEQAVQNYRRALEEGRLQNALDRALRDGRYDRGVLRALRDGQRLDQARIDAMVERYRQRWLKYRAEAIARTETVRASNAGQRELWRQARSQGLLGNAKRKWIASGDERTCATCMDLNGEVRDLDEEFAPGILDPPDPHPTCRCTTGLVFGRKLPAAAALAIAA